MSSISLKTLWVGVGFAALVAVLGVFVTLFLYRTHAKVPLPFTLIDHNGAAYNSAQDQTYKLLFFGFTHCPEVCPTGLSNITAVMEQLGDDAQHIHPVFITVDPDRDSPAVIKDYLTPFHPRFTGLTGDPEAIKGVQEQYAVYARKFHPPDHEEYTMDHSAHVYLSDKDDIVLSVFDYRLEPGIMANKIRGELDHP